MARDHEENAEEEPFYKSKHYYDLKDAATDVGMWLGTKEMLAPTAKLVGKSLFNAALFTGMAGVAVVKNFPAIAKKAREVAEEAAKQSTKK